ncbi:phosphatidylserine decarboxylase family protein [OCS116 cluster bacterium]|nr:phosphatidylserine decarboxylase family protein [OCS116 cluster bacterium]
MNKKYLGIHREGWKFFIIFILISFFSFFITKIIFLISFFLSVFTLWFFRDPERYFDSEDNQVLSAADGKICFIGEDTAPIETDINQKMIKISVFMNVFNVHVNRSPINGEVEKIIYKNGKFFNASLDKASEHNERNSIIINNNNEKIVVVQIAGLIARRILSFISENDTMVKGERIGLIRFGSRVDIYLPLSYQINVNENDIVVAGQTIIAER